MEKLRKCSSKKHSDIDAISFCQECNIYMCNKCSNLHLELFENHYKYDLGKETISLFTGVCQEENHKVELKFYCKKHNILCCAACISKIKGEGYGQHTDCDVCFIEKIKDEKKINLENNLKYLEEFTLKEDKSLFELKKIFEKINEEKEELKKKISKVFTKIRNSINDREDKLLLEVDNIYNNSFLDEKIIKQSEKLPLDIKISLEKGKKIKDEWNNEKTKLNLIINECIDIENNIKKIKQIKNNLEKYSNNKTKIKFKPEEEKEINQFINNINKFGEIIEEEEEKDKLYITNLNSNIINNNFEYNKILKAWINPNKKIRAELLFKLSRDGDKVSRFHELCDEKGPTLTLFYVNDKNIGGIYTPLSWDNSGYKYNNETFMFNLYKKERYKNISNERSIYCNNFFGPWTIDFGFSKNLKKIEHRGLCINKIYDKGCEILPNKSNKTILFDVEEIEIFKIIIE